MTDAVVVQLTAPDSKPGFARSWAGVQVPLLTVTETALEVVTLPQASYVLAVMECVEPFVQCADPFAVIDFERVEFRLYAQEFGAAFAEHGFERDHLRAQRVRVVVIPLS